MRKKSKYKPLLFTTTVRNPKRMKGLLNVFSQFDGEILTDEKAEQIMGELIRCGLYRPRNQIQTVREKWKDTSRGNFSTLILEDNEVKTMLENNPQNHKEAGFKKGWPSRFATEFDFAKELGFVFFRQNDPIKFSKVGLKLANSIEVEEKDGLIIVSEVHPEFEQQAFLHALAKYQRNNPFVRVLNENSPLVLLLQVIKKLNSDSEYNGTGISRMEIPLIIFWKNNNAEELYQLIKKIRKKYRYEPPREVIVHICIHEILGGDFKKFNPKSVMIDYPDEFIRKMRVTGLFSLRGRGRFLDINKKEQETVDYILEQYSDYEKYDTEEAYFEYMATVDEMLISFTIHAPDSIETNKYLEKWAKTYSWDQIKEELLKLAHKKLSKDDILKYLPDPVRLEFLVAIAIKSRFPKIEVVPHYSCDDEGVPTSTAGGDKGDIECFEESKGILVEVTMSGGRAQTLMEVWPIARHLEQFNERVENRGMCYFVAPSIFIDSERQIQFAQKEYGLHIVAKTLKEFLQYIEKRSKLYV